jgi:hypothetical protein
MRKLLSLVAVGAIACQGVPTDAPLVEEPQPLLSATTTTTNVTTPVAIGAFIPCALGGAGEIALVTGNLHSLIHVTTSDAGNTVVKTHFQPMGLAGTGQTSGLKYQATGVTQDVLTVNGDPPWNFTFVNNFRFIGQGPGNNFHAHTTAHITVNANGEVTVDFSLDRTSCG